MADRVAKCREDMRKLNLLADEIERTFTAVDTTGSNDNWKGPGGDRFRGEWKVQKDAISSALHEARQEAKRVVERIRNEEEKKKTTMNGPK